MLKKIIITILVLVLVIVSVFLYKEDNKVEATVEPVLKEIGEEVKEECHVDIKGEVVNKGVYECVKNDKVIDIINKAGGLTKNADTSLINLSKNVKNEMLIIIYSKRQIEDAKKRLNEPTVIETIKEIEIIKEIEKECVCLDQVNEACEIPYVDNSNESVNKKININTASKEELMTLPKIGDAKAKSIIEYRTNQKFETLEDIKKVSGIGDALYNEVKDLIEV